MATSKLKEILKWEEEADRAHFRCFEVQKWVMKYYHWKQTGAVVLGWIILALAAFATVAFFTSGSEPARILLSAFSVLAVVIVSLAWGMHQASSKDAAQKYVQKELALALGIVQLEGVNMQSVEKGLACLAHMLYACQHPGYAAPGGMGAWSVMVSSGLAGLFGYARALARLAFTWEKVRLQGSGPDKLVDPLDKEVLRKTYPLDTLTQHDPDLWKNWALLAWCVAHAPQELLAPFSTTPPAVLAG